MKRNQIIAVFLFATFILAIAFFLRRGDKTKPEDSNLAEAKENPSIDLAQSQLGEGLTETSSKVLNEENIPDEQKTSSLFKLRPILKNGLSIEQVEELVAKNERSMNVLLFAGLSTNLNQEARNNFLLEAARSYPNEPQVQFSILASGLLPDERSQWIEEFKKSDPDNAYANYFSALENLRGENLGLAIEDLRMAREKEVKDYFHESWQNAEEYYRSTGLSYTESKIVAMNSSLTSIQIDPVIELTSKLFTNHDETLDRGDQKLANEIAALGFTIGNEFSQGRAAYSLLGQFIGLAAEKQFLSKMPNNESNISMLTEIEQQERELRELATHQALLFTLNENDFGNYVDRFKTFGEESAMKWLVEKSGTQP